MKSPLVLRESLEAAERSNDEFAAQLIAQRKTIADLITERVYNLRLRDEAVAQLGVLKDLCNQLQAKQRDIDDPPISREELGATLKRLSFHQVRAEALEAEVAQLKERLETARNAPAAKTLLKEKPCRSNAGTAAKRSARTSARKSQPASRRGRRSR